MFSHVIILVWLTPLSKWVIAETSRQHPLDMDNNACIYFTDVSVYKGAICLTGTCPRRTHPAKVLYIYISDMGGESGRKHFDCWSLSLTYWVNAQKFSLLCSLKSYIPVVRNEVELLAGRAFACSNAERSRFKVSNKWDSATLRKWRHIFVLWS